MKIKQTVIDFLREQPLYSTSWCDKINNQAEYFRTLEDATAHYNSIDVMDFRHAGSDYWLNNDEGQTAELRILEELPVSLVQELNDAEDAEEIARVFMDADPHHTYARRLQTKYSYLSDEWENECRVIKEDVVKGITYGTYFGDKPEMISIKDLIVP